MLRERGRQLYLAWMATDVAITAAVFVALALYPGMRVPGDDGQLGLATLASLAVVTILGWPLILGRLGLYRSQRRERMRGWVGRLALANMIGALVLSTLAFALAAPVAPAFPLVLAATLFGVQSALRLPIFAILRAARRAGRNYRNVLIIGAGPRALEADATIERHPSWGLRTLGFIDDGGVGFVPSVPANLVHKFADLPRLLREEIIDEVLVACPRAMLGALAPIVRECAMIGIPVTLLTDLFGDELPAPRAGAFDAVGTLSFAKVHHNEVELSLKRALDIFGSIAVMILTAPILLISLLAVRLTAGNPTLFRQVRCGLNGRPFVITKLRTMNVDAEKTKSQLMHLNEMDGPVFKIRDDPRVTRVGRILRKWSIDELPQLWNVLKGDMSLVGPRPPTPDEVVLYEGSQRRRLSMRPGITCLWQVSGRNDVSFQEWMKLDLEYIDTWTLTRDLTILAKTVPQVLLARGAR